MDAKNKNASVMKMRGVTFGYNGRPVLENVDMDIEPGDFIALIGPNGAAKSTLLKLMLGLERPWRGLVLLFDSDVRAFRDWSKIGYISQQAVNINTSFPATVEEVVASGYYTGIGRFPKKKALREAVDAALESTGISDLSSRLIGELSGGQRQKVFLARALVHRPEALYLDEPTTGIDAVSSEEFYNLLAELNRRLGLTVVLVTHDISSVFKHAGKIGCVGGGSVHIHHNGQVTEAHLAEVFGYTLNRR